MPIKIEQILADFEKASGRRSSWDDLWQQVVDLIMPTREFNRTRTGGERRRVDIYDETGPNACLTLASGLHGLLTNPGLQWLTFAVEDDGTRINEDEQVRTWLDTIRNMILGRFASPEFGFNTQAHEVYMDLAGFGTAAMILAPTTTNSFGMRFQSRPLSEMYIAEDEMDRPRTMFRKFKLSHQQAWDKWGKLAPKDTVEIFTDPNSKGNKFEERDYLHAVGPRLDFYPDRRDRRNKPFFSIHIEMKEKEMVGEESGFDEMPYMFSRFEKASGEVYGRGPGIHMLNTVRTANAMKKTILMAGEKAVAPPLLVMATGVDGPIHTGPNAITWTRQGLQPAQTVQALTSGNRMDIGVELLALEQQTIKQGFFNDVIGPLPIVDRATTVEINARMQQRMQIMSPILSRLEEEFLDQVVTKVYNHMVRTGQFPMPPDILQDRTLEIKYVSPLALSQRASEAVNINQWAQFIAPYSQGDPTVLDVIDTAEIGRYGGYLFNVPQRVMRTRQEVMQIREQREEVEQAQAQAQIAEQTASAAHQGAQALTEVANA